MKRRMILGITLLAAVGVAVPVAQASTHATDPTLPPLPAACVVVTLPDGSTIQLGYVPNGPDECVQLPPA